MLANRINRMTPSATVGLSATIANLKRQEIDIIAFNLGQPDFPTPENICRAGQEAINKGHTKYTEVSGLFELRQAISIKLEKDNDLDYHPSEVIVSNGSKQSLINALLTLVNPGEEVLLPSPYWVSYVEMIKLTGARPVIVNMDEKSGFALDTKKIAAAINEHTRAIIINTPNNPTGAVYSETELKALGQLAVENDLYVIADEIYEKLIYGNQFHVSLASVSEEIKNRTVTVNGFSKGFSMTGWRVGYAAGPREIIRGMTSLQGHMTSCANSISQWAAIEALQGSQQIIEKMRSEYDRRRQFLLTGLRSLPGISCAEPFGAFYLMPNFSRYYGYKYQDDMINNSVDMANFLLKEAHVALVPGSAFGAPDNIRITYSNSMKNIKDGLFRIERGLSLLAK